MGQVLHSQHLPRSSLPPGQQPAEKAKGPFKVVDVIASRENERRGEPAIFIIKHASLRKRSDSLVEGVQT